MKMKPADVYAKETENDALKFTWQRKKHGI